MGLFRKSPPPPEPVAPTPELAQHFLFASGQVRSLADPEDWLKQLFGIFGDIEGVDDSAMMYSASSASIRLIAGSVAECPVHCYRRSADGNRERLRDHPVELLLNGYASPWQLSPDFLRKMTARALRKEKGAFARVVRLRSGKAVELHILKNGVTVDVDDATGEPRYKVALSNGGEEILTYRDIIHLESPTGSAPAHQARKAINLGLLIENAMSKLFANGGQPTGILSVKQAMTTKAAQEVLEGWKTQRAENPGGVAVLGNDVTWTPLAMSSVDQQTAELRKQQVIDVLRFFGVSPTKAGQLEDASLNNAESLGRQFLTDCLAPWLTSWVCAISRTLIDPKERATVYAEFETAAAVSGDFKATAEGLKNLVGGPLLTPNDGRSRLNLPRVEGGDSLYPVAGASPDANGNGGASNA
jgi:HK97 family phage portal protein